ncbi:MAG: radical SAM protein [Promethearchaeota archaeon]
MYDPLELSSRINSKIVKDKTLKKYYRFRCAKYYGGVSTVDVVGCNMYCHFCWVHPKFRYCFQKVGKFYTPGYVGQRLIQIAQKANFKLLRISGGEPTIGKPHLISLLKYLNNYPYQFILETNGMLLSNENYVKEFKDINNIHVRIALKAGTPETFSKVTGAVLEAYYYPFKALKFLLKYKISCHPSIIVDFCPKKDFQFLLQVLQKIDPSLINKLEYESLIFYPHVKKGLEKIGY